MYEQDKILALAFYLGVDIDNIEELPQEDYYKCGNREYRIYTDSEAEDTALEYYTDWAEQEMDIHKIPDHLRYYFDLDRYAQDAVMSNGREIALANYDGEEIEINTTSQEFTDWLLENDIEYNDRIGWLYIYRAN